MITGVVSDDGVPVVAVQIAGQQWTATVDTGFNGDLELPEEARHLLKAVPIGRLKSTLAGGQAIEEDAYSVDCPFDGETLQAIATFVRDSPLLIGTNLLRHHHLQIWFASKTLQLERE